MLLCKSLTLNTRLQLDRFFASGVGSLPHINPKDASNFVFKHLEKHIPFWPQLPKRNFKENMYVQYSQALPGVVVDINKKQIYIDTLSTDYPGQLEEMYQHCLSEDLQYFAITQDYAAGLYEFIQHPASRLQYPFIKGQIIGPFSFGLTVSDQNKKAIIYNEEFRDCLTKLLTMKALWQIKELNAHFSNSKIIICIDEPYLVSLGSSYFNVSSGIVIEILNEIIDRIHEKGAFVSLHCCGNTDWPVILGTNIDILNFDSYGYLDTLFLYRTELDNFLKRGGVIAWGAAPISSDYSLDKLEMSLKKIDEQKRYCLITPSCGLSGVREETADEIFSLTVKLAERLSASNFSKLL